MRLQAGSDSMGRIREDGVQPIPGRVEHIAIVCFDGFLQDGVVAGKCDAHCLRVSLEKTGTTLDVREEERNRSGQQVSHGRL